MPRRPRGEYGKKGGESYFVCVRRGGFACLNLDLNVRKVDSFGEGEDEGRG